MTNVKNKSKQPAKKAVLKVPKQQLVVYKPPVPMGKATNTTRNGQSPKQKMSQRQQAARRIPQFTMCQIDPFAPECFGAKVPDESTAPSSTAFSRTQYPLSTGSGFGGCGAVFRYHPAAFAVDLIPASSTSWANHTAFAGTTATSNQLALASAYSEVRAVGFGIKLSTRLNYTTASGVVHIALVPDILDKVTWNYPTGIGAMEYSPYYRRIPLADLIENEMLINGKYTDLTAFRYVDPAIPDFGPTSAVFPSTGWLAIQVWYEGAINITNALDIEYIAQYECFSQASSTTLGVMSVSPASPSSPAVMAATSYLIDATEPIKVVSDTNENEPDFWQGVTSVFDTGLKIANGVASALEYAGMFAAMLL